MVNLVNIERHALTLRRRVEAIMAKVEEGNEADIIAQLEKAVEVRTVFYVLFFSLTILLLMLMIVMLLLPTVMMMLSLCCP